MADSNIASGSLVVSTTRNESYVIPQAALEQYRATPEQQQEIDEAATSKVQGSFATLDAGEASAQSNFASEDEVTALAWFQGE